MYDETSDAEILIENFPLRYELRNIDRTTWENVTKLHTIKLAEEYLLNENSKSLIMTREPILRTNFSVTYEFPVNIAKGMEMRVYQDDTIQRLVVGEPRPVIVESQIYRIMKKISPESHMDVKVEGTLANVWYEIHGDLTLVYDGLRVDTKIKARIIETKVVDVKSIASIQTPLGVPYIEDPDKEMDPQKRRDIFNIIFYVACCIFFGTVIIAWTDVAIKLIRMRRDKNTKRGRSGTSSVRFSNTN